jgi:hypothetical protein
MILAGGAALAAPMVVTGCQRASEDATPLSASDRSVSAISGSDAAFDAALATLYPGLQSDPVFQKIAPLAVLITHQQGPAIRAYSVSWAITTPAGSYETVQYYYDAPGSQRNGRSVSTLGSARPSILQAGASHLFTPFFTWTPEFYQSSPHPDWTTILKPIEPGTFLVSELPKATEVKVSLDGVVFSDWKIVGPDKHHLSRLLRSRRNAEHDEGLAVYKLLKAGASDDVISETLQSHGAVQRSNAKAGSRRWYAQFRRFHAQVLLRHFQDADRPTFTKALVRLVRQRKTVIARVNA